jgi:hypothetical protein
MQYYEWMLNTNEIFGGIPVTPQQRHFATTVNVEEFLHFILYKFLIRNEFASFPFCIYSFSLRKSFQGVLE